MLTKWRALEWLLWSPATTRSLSSKASPVKTALFDLHVQHGAKMVDFAGYWLPVVYSSDSIGASHLHTRCHSSVFDVSHMLQTKIYGADRAELVERVATLDIAGLLVDQAGLTLFTHPETGGILDDLIVTKTSQGYLYIVSNAGRRVHDSRLLLNFQETMKAEGKDVTVELLDTADVSLVAVQGPRSAQVLGAICKAPVEQLPFMTSTITTIGGIEGCRISRCGYTGEDGYEISVASSAVQSLTALLLQSQAADVKLAGLGARDSLRLEAGLCLYGHDINEGTSPVEASLAWLVPPTRRARKDFPGAQVICQQLQEGVTRKRIGLKLKSGPPAREGCEVRCATGKKIGFVTSGGPSPSLCYNIAMGYLDIRYCNIGTEVQVAVRGKNYTATVVKMPFMPVNYFSKPTS